MILAVDTETTGTDVWHGCRPFLVTMCDGRQNYHFAGTVNPYNRVDVRWDQEILNEIQDMLEDAQMLLFHNAKFDLHMLASIGIDLTRLWNKVEDTMIASHCLSSGESHALKYLALKYMDYDNEDEQLLEQAVKSARLQHKDYDIAKPGHPSFPGIKGAKVNWWKMDYWLCLDECLRYGLGDVERTWGLWQIFYEALQNYDLTHQYSVRKAMVKIAYDMEVRGYHMYSDEVDEELQYLADYREGLHKKIQKECKIGGYFDLGKEADLRFFLFTVLGIKPFIFTEKTEVPSISKEAIDTMIESNSDVKALQDFQQYRIAGTQIGYLSSYRKWICDDNRIRASVFITGTRSCRQAYRDPNLQNIDKRMRHVFGPPPGYVWLDYDLVNIELRIWVYEVGNKELVEAFNEGRSVHMMIAEELHPEKCRECKQLGVSFKDQYPEHYGWVKNGNFAIIYGATEKKANQTYHVMDAYSRISERFPEVPQYTKSVINEMWYNLEEYHWPHVTCIGGYKLDVPTDEPFVACNYKIQGSASYIMNEALINISRNSDYIKSGAQMIQQVHDSIVIEVQQQYATDTLIHSIKRSIESAGLKYLPTCEASYHIITNTQPPF
jgi:DNA polymerase I-like protein with 3'-5' exonuclease and polymerase domains